MRCLCSLLQASRAGRGDLYLVRIDVVAHPSAAEMEPLDEGQIGRRIDARLKQIAGVSHEEAMKQVFDHKTIYLCCALATRSG